MGERRSDELAQADVVFVVIDHDGPMLHGAYRHGGNAQVHARCVGAGVVSVHLLERVPQSVLDSGIGEFDEESPTIRVELCLEDLADVPDDQR